MKEDSPEWVIDYEAIVSAHLARRPSRVWPGFRFALPMSEEEWMGFPKMPGWKYEWDIRLADTQFVRLDRITGSRLNGRPLPRRARSAR